MSIESEKLELIDWISNLKDHEVLHKLLHVKHEIEKEPENVVRKFGDGKYLISYIAEDFNDPIDHFGEDTKP